jgi:hypothetical protein
MPTGKVAFAEEVKDRGNRTTDVSSKKVATSYKVDRMKVRMIKRRRDKQAQESLQRLYDLKRTPEEQAWLDIVPVGREFGSPDWERLAMLDSGATAPTE